MFGKTFTLIDNNPVQLNCLNNKLIFVYSALNGLYFSIPNNARPICPDVCYRRSFFEDTKVFCENKQTCQLNNLAEPFWGCYFTKNVRYICADSSIINMLNQCQNISRTLPPEICPKSNDPNINDQTWFDGYQNTGANITCQNSKKIQIKCAFYGFDIFNSKINPNIQYNTPTTAYYRSNKAMEIMRNCNNLTECVIYNNFTSTEVNYDPMSILQIQWTCLI